MSGPIGDPRSLQTDLSKVINAITAATQALTQASGVLKRIDAQIGTGGLAGAGSAPQPPPATINTWEDDPFSEDAPTGSPPMAPPVSQTVVAASTNTALAWQIEGPQLPPGNTSREQPTSSTGTHTRPSPDPSFTGHPSCRKAPAGPANKPRSR